MVFAFSKNPEKTLGNERVEEATLEKLNEAKTDSKKDKRKGIQIQEISLEKNSERCSQRTGTVHRGRRRTDAGQRLP